MACSDDLYMPSSSPAEGQALRFEVTVIDQPQTRGAVLDVYDNYVTRDFKSGDSFGMFIIDDNNQFVSTIDGKNAKNLKLTTPDGKAWNLNSDIKEVVHKLGYKYVAYYPYSSDFDDCTSIADIKSRLTAPADDQSTQAAIDWMYTEPTPPGVNAVTVLKFKHRYAKIDIYHSFTQEHSGDWTLAFKYNKTVDKNNVEHYRYILNSESPQTLKVNGKYSIGNYLTGIKEMSYDCNGITIANGHHAIVYTYGMDERCAVDLGLPSGIRWSPINLGAENATYMDEAAIASAENLLGRRLAWGELFEKDSYSYASYINDPYIDDKKTLLPADISGTVYDPVTQYWGGHWSMPSNDDFKELIANIELISTETVASDELGKDIKKLTFKSKINGNTITMLSNGYINNTSLTYPQYLYYMSANLSSHAYCMIMNDNPLNTYNFNRYQGMNIRPVLKELYTYSDADKKDIILRHIDDLAVDLGITKTVTENGEKVTYKLLWSPFNYGAECEVNLQSYNGAPINENYYITKCYDSPGMRLAWGDIEKPAGWWKDTYNTSAIAQKYPWSISGNDKDARDLQPEDDIVHLNWPTGWYIPTARDYEWLIDGVTITYNSGWFTLTSKTNGNSIKIPGTSYIDNSDYKNIALTTSVYLESCTIGTGTGQPTQYALNINNSDAKGQVVGTAGRATGLMIRPVKYVRVN